MSAGASLRSCLRPFAFSPLSPLSLIVIFGQRIGKDLLARITRAAQIDLRFGDLACEFLEFDVGGRPGKL